MPGLFDDRIYLDLALSKSIETDANGNYIIEAEASNENLDFQEQVVLQRALLESKDYFLANGVVSWNHEHKFRDAKGRAGTNPENVIGEPLGVFRRGVKTFVKALLYKGNKWAEDIVSKLKQGSTRIKTSVGGMRPVVQTVFDKKLKRPVEQVVSVLWDDLAITFAPVNQTLSPVALTSAAFVKSLTAGYTTDSATATGGAALCVQDLEGADRRKKAIQAVVTAIAVGDVRTPRDGLDVLAESGVESKEASDILEEVVNRRKKLQEVFRMDANLAKSFDEAVEELEKAMKGGAPAPAPATPPAPMPAPQPEPENEEEEEDEDEEGNEEQGKAPPAPPAAPPMPPMQKSVEDDEDMEFLDVSPILAKMAKSLKDIKADNRALRDTVASQGEMLKSMGNAQLQSAMVLKSMADTPSMRKSVISRQDRFVAGEGAAKVEMTPGEILRKSTAALGAGKLSLRQATIIEDRVNKGLDIDAETLSMLKSL